MQAKSVDHSPVSERLWAKSPAAAEGPAVGPGGRCARVTQMRDSSCAKTYSLFRSDRDLFVCDNVIGEVGDQVYCLHICHVPVS